MGIGDVFARAFELWRRDVGWLILAGLVVGLIMVVIFGVVFGIFGAIFAGAGLTIGANMADSGSDALGAVGAGMVVLGIIVGVLALFLVQVVALVFYGGMFEMVIGAARGSRGVQFGDLFSGFRKFGAYTVFALVMFGINIGTGFIQAIPLIGWILGLAVSVWISVIWLYVLPLIADQGVGFGEAASRSNQMVKGVGWWRTFGMVVVLYLAIIAVTVVIILIAVLVAQASEWVGILLGLLLFLVFFVVVPPYVICYVSTMYLGSGGAAPVAVTGAPPLPPSAPGAPTYGTPPSPTIASPGAGDATAVTAPGTAPPPPVGPDAWKAASDPLAGQTAAGSPADGQEPVPPADETALTEAPPAASDAPGAPEPPVAPPPPGG